MNFNEAKIVHREPHFFKRKLIEASYIKLSDQPISQSSVEIRPLWLPILNKELKSRENKIMETIQDFNERQNSHSMETRSKVRGKHQINQ